MLLFSSCLDCFKENASAPVNSGIPTGASQSSEYVLSPICNEYDCFPIASS